MSTLIKPRPPAGSEPSGDEDPTGVRALLSSLPDPEPMPGHVVDRINASLAAEQAERAAGAPGTPGTPVITLLSRMRRRPARILFATVGAAAAVALVAVVGSTLSSLQQQDSATSAAVARPTRATLAPVTEGKGQLSGPTSPTGPAAAAARPPTPAAPADGGTAFKRMSDVQYTRTDFVTQARSLKQAANLYSLNDRSQPLNGAAESTTRGRLGTAGTAAGLPGCLRVIGADRAQSVQIDVSTYEGKPAVIIVATTNGKTLAYAAGPQCGPTKTFLLRPAVVIPPP